MPGLYCRHMDQDPQLSAPGQFAGPANDIFLSIPIKVPLSERHWIKRFKQLADFVDLQFDG